MFLIFRSIDFISLKKIAGGNSEKIEIFQNRYFSGTTITNVTGRFFAKIDYWKNNFCSLKRII
jgi:hypothetical protein